MDTFFDILEVLGCPAADFFDEGPEEALTIYREEDMTMMEDAKHHTTVTWLNPDSNEHEMEPVILEFAVGGSVQDVPTITFRNIWVCARRFDSG